jgi:tetraacyldisaccharide 4'-kinase
VSLDRILQRVWYERAPWPLFLALVPLSLLFASLVAVRRWAYRVGAARSMKLSRPVVVVGNVTVGGTGKTPLVIWIAEYLRARGCNVGIVTRGYGGNAQTWPQDVTDATPAEHVGDEAVLLAARTQAIVVAGPDRVAAAQRALDRGADVIVSDDGLQHYRLARDLEIAVVDDGRDVGNGWLLPAGPLRERRSRLDAVDLVVRTCRSTRPSHALGRQILAVNLATGERRLLSAFSGARVHAVAAIGHPEAFFAMLEERGLSVDARALRDHARLTREDVTFGDDAPVLMTEKDAVKCKTIASERHWAVRLGVRFGEGDERKLRTLLDRLIDASRTSPRRE